MDITYKVTYQHGEYRGIIHVTADENAEREAVINRAKRHLFKDTPGLSCCYESFKVERDEN
jgi:hypothetical protein